MTVQSEAPAPATLGVDVGGTKIAAGVVDADGRILAQLRVPTASRDVGAAVVEAARRAVEESPVPVVAVGIGAAGLIRADRSTVAFAPNLSWRDEPLGARVAAALQLPTVVENDANAAAWGEHRFGAGAGATNLMVVTVGTGIGSGIVLDSRLVRGGAGMAAELGHVRVVPDGLPCGCGQRGCLEQYASGTALVRDVRARWRSTAPGPVAAGVLAGASVSAAQVDGPLVTRAALDGDPDCVAALAELGRWLGAGVASAAALLDPSVVVVGGGVAGAGELLLDPLRSALAEHLPGAGHRPLPTIVAATLGNDAGLVGAADLARDLL